MIPRHIIDTSYFAADYEQYHQRMFGIVSGTVADVQQTSTPTSLPTMPYVVNYCNHKIVTCSVDVDQLLFDQIRNNRQSAETYCKFYFSIDGYVCDDYGGIFDSYATQVSATTFQGICDAYNTYNIDNQYNPLPNSGFYEADDELPFGKILVDVGYHDIRRHLGFRKILAYDKAYIESDDNVFDPSPTGDVQNRDTRGKYLIMNVDLTAPSGVTITFNLAITNKDVIYESEATEDLHNLIFNVYNAYNVHEDG